VSDFEELMGGYSPETMVFLGHKSSDSIERYSHLKRGRNSWDWRCHIQEVVWIESIQ